MSLAPRAVVVHRQTEYDELLARHGTRRQVEFFLERRGQSLAALDDRHLRQRAALESVARAVPDDWRRARIDRGDLHQWLFEPDDVVITVGQDGLVANVAKYLDGQPVIGVDPDPERNPGVLVRHDPDQVAALLRTIDRGGLARLRVAGRAMVEVVTDDGRDLRALNEIYLGHSSHQSSRYVIAVPDAGDERQSSSGMLVGTGTGATGWCASLWREQRPPWSLPEATDADLAWFVREAWPSPATGTELTSGRLAPGQELRVTVASDDLVVFGDGIESDRLELRWGQTCRIRTAEATLRLVS